MTPAIKSKRAAVSTAPSRVTETNSSGALAVKGNEPNEPAFTLPLIASPSIVPANSSVIGNGVVIAFFHDTALPSALAVGDGLGTSLRRLGAGQRRGRQP